MWSVGGSALSVSGAGTKMGLRRYRMPTRRLFGSHTLGGIGVHFHVDLRRSLSSYQKTVEIRDRTDENPMSMLDGLHVDQRGDDVLPAFARLQQADLRSRGLHLHARLGQHGRIHHHAVDPRAGTVGHHHRLHVLLYFLHDEATEVRRGDPRQRVRYCAIGKSKQPEPHYVLRLSDGFLGVMGTVRRAKDIRGR